MDETIYPFIDEMLLNALKRDFPNEIPMYQLSEFELGKLVGQQEIIQFLDAQYTFQKNEETDNEED